MTDIFFIIMENLGMLMRASKDPCQKNVPPHLKKHAQQKFVAFLGLTDGRVCHPTLLVLCKKYLKLCVCVCVNSTSKIIYII